MPQVAADEEHRIQTEACLAPSRVFRGHRRQRHICSGSVGPRVGTPGGHASGQGVEPGRPGCCGPLPTAYRGTGSRRPAEGLDVRDVTQDKPAFLQLSYRGARQDGPHTHLKPDSIRPCA